MWTSLSLTWERWASPSRPATSSGPPLRLLRYSQKIRTCLPSLLSISTHSSFSASFNLSPRRLDRASRLNPLSVNFLRHSRRQHTDQANAGTHEAKRHAHVDVLALAVVHHDPQIFAAAGRRGTFLVFWFAAFGRFLHRGEFVEQPLCVVRGDLAGGENLKM